MQFTELISIYVVYDAIGAGLIDFGPFFSCFSYRCINPRAEPTTRQCVDNVHRFVAQSYMDAVRPRRLHPLSWFAVNRSFRPSEFWFHFKSPPSIFRYKKVC